MKSNYLSLNEKHLFQDYKTSKILVYWFSFLEKITSVNWFSVILNSTIPNLVIHLERGDSNIFFLFLFAIMYVYRSDYSFGYRFPYSSEFIFKKGKVNLYTRFWIKFQGIINPPIPCRCHCLKACILGPVYSIFETCDLILISFAFLTKSSISWLKYLQNWVT